MSGTNLDATDTLELAELLEFTADAIGWRHAAVIHADLQAHLRRWAHRLHPRSNADHQALPDPPAIDATTLQKTAP